MSQAGDPRREELASLRAEVASLREQVRVLAERQSPKIADGFDADLVSTAGSSVVNRRTLLSRAGVVVAAGGAGLAVGASSSPASADADQYMIIGVMNQGVDRTTGISSHGIGGAFVVDGVGGGGALHVASKDGTAIDVSATNGIGVKVFSNNDTAIVASAEGSGSGIRAYSYNRNAVLAFTPSSAHDAVLATTMGTGNGVRGEQANETSTSSGVYGIAYGPGSSVIGVKPSGIAGNAVTGQADSGVGVNGTSVNGRITRTAPCWHWDPQDTKLRAWPRLTTRTMVRSPEIATTDAYPCLPFAEPGLMKCVRRNHYRRLHEFARGCPERRRGQAGSHGVQFMVRR